MTVDKKHQHCCFEKDVTTERLGYSASSDDSVSAKSAANAAQSDGSENAASRSPFKCIFPRKINTDLIQYLPISSYKGVIELIENDDQLDAALPEILREKILGFDTETRPNFSRDKHYLVSILQLGGKSKVWIIRLEPLKHRIPDIYEILENPAIKKVGVAVNGDISALKERWLFSPAGFRDISKSTKEIGVINTGMRNLAALILGERISKAAQLTNWASDSLTEKQLEYAATDAWISRRLFLAIKNSVENTNIIIEPDRETSGKFNLKVFVSDMIKSLAKKIISGSGNERQKKNSAGVKPQNGRRQKNSAAEPQKKKSARKKPANRQAKKTPDSDS